MSGENKQPYVRFFPSDWLGGTRGMSAEETGVYITLIMLMYERCEPLPEDHGRLARQCGCTKRAFIAHLDTLLDLGKVERTDRGLWQNRVEKEFLWRRGNKEKAQQAASARWEKDNKNKGRHMQTHPPSNACGDAPDMPIQKPEARSQKPKEKNSPKRKAYSDLFNDQFWMPYPRSPNMSKSEAWAEWKKLDTSDQESAVKSLAAFRSWLKANPDHPVIHACRYLSKRRFEGFAEAKSLGAKTGQAGGPDWDFRGRQWFEQGFWSPSWEGGPPGSGDWRGPPEIEAKYRKQEVTA